ncbi:MAG: SDR family oxidoreductase [Planctomycetota bacterium]
MIAGETVLERNHRIFGVEHPVALVTGSRAPRVGNAIAALLEDQGFQLVYHGHREDSGQASGNSPDASSTVFGAVEEERNVRQWCEQILGHHGRIDLLVNSAAIWEPKDLEETSSQDFTRFFEVNSLGVALLCKHFGLAMVKQASGGAIINIGDWAVARPYPDFSAYFLSKGGLETLTRTMAVELAHRNPRIRVNAILPGPVLLADEIDAQREQRIVEESLLKRAGTAEDVATAALFLATSLFVTGVCLPVDGGRSIHAGVNSDAIAHPRVS